MKMEPDTKDKIILSENLQREIIKFFLKTSVPKLASKDKSRQQTSPINAEEC
jgi:hypothetical protein